MSFLGDPQPHQPITDSILAKYLLKSPIPKTQMTSLLYIPPPVLLQFFAILSNKFPCDRTLLWLSVISLPLLVGVWMIEILVATERDVILTYMLAVIVVLQAWFTLCGYCFGNARIRISLRRITSNVLGRKVPPLPEEDIDSPVKSTSPSNSNPAVSNHTLRADRRKILWKFVIAIIFENLEKI